MKHGDISNELPQRIVVVADVFLDVELNVKKKFKVLKKVTETRSYRREILSHLYLLTSRRGITLELVSFDLSQDELAQLYETLDAMGTNPFRYFSSYVHINKLINELPYRPEVIGVLDIPERLLRYGHWGLDFKSL